MKSRIKTIALRALATTALLTFCFSAGGAEAAKYGRAAENKIFAQALVYKIMAANPGLLSAGIHCIPPAGGTQTIVASTLDIIGKLSDPEDIQVRVDGITHVYPVLKVPKLGIMLPLHDREGKIIGALALAFKYRPGEDEAQYFVLATAIRNGVAKEIPNLSELFASAQIGPSS